MSSAENNNQRFHFCPHSSLISKRLKFQSCNARFLDYIRWFVTDPLTDRNPLDMLSMKSLFRVIFYSVWKTMPMGHDIYLQVLKLYAWEPQFIRSILDIRNKELDVLRSAAVLNTVNYVISFSSTFMVCKRALETYWIFESIHQRRKWRFFAF